LDQDLSDLDLSQFKRIHFEFERTVDVNIRMPKSLLAAVKQKSLVLGITDAKFMREAIERAVQSGAS
jgi:predicted DNA binding CopG/RHH family protein